MGVPHQILIAPFTVYTAPTGEAFPEIDAAPAGNWSLLGQGGASDYPEGSAVEIVKEQDIFTQYSEGSTGPRKQSRTQERLTIRISSMDMALENLTKAIQGVTPDVQTVDTGTPGYKSIGLFAGVTVNNVAVLVRGQSSYDNTLNLQYNLPVAAQVGNITISGQKGASSLIAFEFMALEDPDAASADLKFGELFMQTAAAL